MWEVLRESCYISPSCPGTYYVYQASLILTVILLPLPPQHREYQCVPPHPSKSKNYIFLIQCYTDELFLFPLPPPLTFSPHGPVSLIESILVCLWLCYHISMINFLLYHTQKQPCPFLSLLFLFIQKLDPYFSLCTKVN